MIEFCYQQGRAEFVNGVGRYCVANFCKFSQKKLQSSQKIAITKIYKLSALERGENAIFCLPILGTQDGRVHVAILCSPFSKPETPGVMSLRSVLLALCTPRNSHVPSHFKVFRFWGPQYSSAWICSVVVHGVCGVACVVWWCLHYVVEHAACSAKVVRLSMNTKEWYCGKCSMHSLTHHHQTQCSTTLSVSS